MGKGVLARIQANIQAKEQEKYFRKMDTILQMAQDAAILAAHDVFQLGPGRAVKFGIAYRDAVNEIAQFLADDSKDDPECTYAKAKIDTRLKAIVGAENFCPWEERYQ